MYIENLTISNFGQFEESNIKFAYPGVNVIIANNGFGKSTILDVSSAELNWAEFRKIFYVS